MRAKRKQIYIYSLNGSQVGSVSLQLRESWCKVWGTWVQQQPLCHWHLVALFSPCRYWPLSVLSLKQSALMHLILASQETLQWNCSPKESQKNNLLGLKNKSELSILSPGPFLHHHLLICKEWLNEHHQLCSTGHTLSHKPLPAPSLSEPSDPIYLDTPLTREKHTDSS